jgi:F420-non-reducing hydrogenase iron-sulfur subunit
MHQAKAVMDEDARQKNGLSQPAGQHVVPDAFEPVAIAFVCNWCTYTAADLAGTSRLTYPDNVRLVRVMCTGMVDTQYVIKAFLEGADAVLVSGCHPGDCHYINGNYKARRRIKLLKQILPRFGIETQRLRLTWIGASDGIEFARTMIRFVDEIKQMGPCQTRLQSVI